MSERPPKVSRVPQDLPSGLNPPPPPPPTPLRVSLFDFVRRGGGRDPPFQGGVKKVGEKLAFAGNFAFHCCSGACGQTANGLKEL